MFCLKRTHSKTGEEYYCHFYPTKEHVRMCMGKESEPILSVELEEDPEGAYYGWREPNGRYCMIYHNEEHFLVCFPYGPDAEEARGRGKKVRLTVKEISHVSTE